MSGVKVLESLDETRKKYAEDWSNNAQVFFEKKYYEWMCKDIEKCQNILEVGCGAGYSTLNLLKRGHKVIAIDEDKYCIGKTKSLLQDGGYEVLCLTDREKVEVSGNRYDIDYSKIENNDISCFDVVLIEGDIINDRNFIDWIINIDSLNIEAVVCWLLGTHNFRGYNKLFDLGKVRNSTQAKIYTQNILFELCSKILVNGGYLQIVDRIGIRNSIKINTIKDDWRNEYCKRITNSMKIESIQIQLYEDPNGIEMSTREVDSNSNIVDIKDNSGISEAFMSTLFHLEKS